MDSMARARKHFVNREVAKVDMEKDFVKSDLVSLLPIELMHHFLLDYLDDFARKAFPVVCRAWLNIEASHKHLWLSLKNRIFPFRNPLGLPSHIVSQSNPMKAVGYYILMLAH